ncbi:hypothetical protein C4J81_11820 [Deltaproteobacteria bacterium Smac51]|nr:hypothetical protein C4J81_11820 [Deltaproteobacteria bacterium Smac51]
MKVFTGAPPARPEQARGSACHSTANGPFTCAPSIRPDLMELTHEALSALANAGFVKRAFKDMEEGRGPAISVKEDGTIEAVYSDGQVAMLESGKSLRDASCTCPAANLCRHRVTLIPAYQEWVRSFDQTAGTEAAEEAATETPVPHASWSPADFTDDRIAESFKKSVIKQAEALAKSAPIIRVVNRAGDSAVPTAYLPMSTVRFFSAQNLAHARCDCIEGGGCAHVVLAIQAFRQARLTDGNSLDLLEQTVVLGNGKQRTGSRVFDSPNAAECRETVHRLLNQLWAEGVSQPLLSLEKIFVAAEAAADSLKWRWIQESITDIRRMTEAYHARSSRFSDLDLLEAMAFLYARLECASFADDKADETVEIPAHQILGIGVAGEVALEHLTLIGLGTELWDDTTHEGVRFYFVDPDTMTLMVMERGFVKNDSSRSGVLGRRVAGLSLKKMSRSQVVTRGAKRKANGTVAFSSDSRLTNVLPLSSQSWSSLGKPLKYGRASELLEYMRSRPPEFIQARQALGRLAILPAGTVLDWGWDAGGQKIWAVVGGAGQDGPAADEDIFRLELPFKNVDKFAVNNLAGHLERQDMEDICGLVGLDRGRIVMVPLALTTADQMAVLATGEAAEAVLPNREPDESEKSETRLVLEKLESVLKRHLITGLRYRGSLSSGDLREMQSTLNQNGFSLCGKLAEALERALRDNDEAMGLKALSQLGLMLQLRKENL